MGNIHRFSDERCAISKKLRRLSGEVCAKWMQLSSHTEVSPNSGEPCTMWDKIFNVVMLSVFAAAAIALVLVGLVMLLR